MVVVKVKMGVVNVPIVNTNCLKLIHWQCDADCAEKDDCDAEDADYLARIWRYGCRGLESPGGDWGRWARRWPGVP